MEGRDDAASRAAAPWRTFRWFKGQKRYSSTYWAATCAGHVTYESRLELGRLQLADFDKSVSWVVSQPFLLEAVVEGKVRRHGLQLPAVCVNMAANLSCFRPTQWGR